MVALTADLHAKNSNPESEADDASCKRPRLAPDDDAEMTDAPDTATKIGQVDLEPASVSPHANTPVNAEPDATIVPAPAAVNGANVDIDEIARCLEEEEATAAAARAAAGEATAEAGVAQPVPSLEDSVMDGDSFALLDFSIPVGAGAQATIAPSNKKLDLALVAKHLEASLPAVERVAGRNVAVLLGNTGVGKSTLLQALAGRAVTRRRFVPGAGLVDGDAMDCSTAEDGDARWVWDAAEPLKGFGIGHEQVSETKCIRHWASTDDSIMYLDAPG